MSDEVEDDVRDADEEMPNRRSFRLIEEFFPAEAVSEQSRKERYQRGKTPHTIFTWWARRPFAAASAVMVTSLLEVEEVDPELTGLVEQFCRGSDPGVLRMALGPKMEAGDQRVLDLFGGGGTIPIEGARLGARVETVENNQLAHFIQHVLLERSQQGRVDLARDVRRAGQRLLEELKRDTEEFFPARDAGVEGATIAYLWSREVRCPDCEGWLSLMRRPWLSKQRGRRWYVDRRPDDGRREYTVELRTEGEPGDEQSAWEGRTIVCPFCDHCIERREIANALKEGERRRLVAVCTSEGRTTQSRKQFGEADFEAHYPDHRQLIASTINDLEAIGEKLPEASLPRWSGVTNPSLYGMARHAELFNGRQRAVLVRLCRLIRDHHQRWEQKMGTERADTIAAFLSGLVDQLVDWNSRLSTWISQNEQVGRALAGPGIPMVWDHVEIDPVEEAPANLWDKLERIVTGIRAIPEFRQTPTARRGDARNLSFDDDTFDVVATDPPYFDNIFYSVLADSIYVWKRLALGDIFGDIFEAPKTDRDRELTMNPHVHAGAEEAADHYTEGMTEVLGEARRVLVDDGVLAMIFAHSTVEGWASIVEALDEAELELVAVWPMYVERAERPRGMSAKAVNTSFVLVARKRVEAPAKREWAGFVEELGERLNAEDEALADDDGYGADTRERTLFGLAVSAFSRAGTLMEEGDEIGVVEGIGRIEEMVEKIV